ncbi:hematopoietic SH2 domain-containing protein homolog [Pempheris klunzingeri]|uniref:hematopoietic SH2 domain-containing protein homolog n=1 Tax=Pempheris klunzingeri TaxID=3127111 RepID=UPI00397F3672
MEQKKSEGDLHMEASEGGLKELVLRWFTKTQAPLILHNGSFPDWFRGFAARKDAEDLLRDKALGCFLIRLSDKAIGYILSYKGHDRCRHFVITQNQRGQFVISGDCQTYGSLTELIEHFKVSPIQPFGEYLNASSHEGSTGELYDVVNYSAKEKSSVSVQALRTLWDQKKDHHGRIQRQNDPLTAPPPAPPPKPKNRKLTGAVSVDPMSLSQGVPPVPKRGIPLSFSLSGSLPDTTSHPTNAPNRSERLRGPTNPSLTPDRDSFHTTDTSPAGSTYFELMQVESRSRSLPSLDNNMEEEEEKEEEEEEEEYSNKLPTVKRVTCLTYSLHDPRDSLWPGSSRSEPQGDDVEMSRANPLYQTSEGPGGSRVPRREVSQGPTPTGLPDDTYEQIPGETTATAAQGNTYESLEDVKTKKSKTTWGKNNIKWKKFLPDYMKK